jgi:transcriptional regulator with XRE-family HTH domain
MIETVSAVGPRSSLSPRNTDYSQDKNQAPSQHILQDHRKMVGITGKRREGVTRETQRMCWLLEQLAAMGVGQAEVARRTGIDSTYLNKLRRLEISGRSSIGADIVRRVKDGLRIDPSYFYDDYEGQKDHRLYLLSAKRDEKRVSGLENGQASLELEVSKLRTDLLELRNQLSGKGGNGSEVRKRR